MKSNLFLLILTITFLPLPNTNVQAQTDSKETQRSFGGIYPHLAMWNPHNECGVGAVVPWAGKLWVITYAPHFPKGSKDKLYTITPELEVTEFDGSVGGTPANRMIHKETNQLLIGPYFIDDKGSIRVVGPDKMVGRLTGTARHLFEPERKAYYATMEEGIYEVDLASLAVNELFADYQNQTGHAKSELGKTFRLMDMPGYHGKGLYSGQGRLIYANNGESSREAKKDPTTPSGVLAEWDGKSDDWKVIRRNQFVDVRGPGGLYGNPNPESDPIWAIGWDHRSLMLMLLDDGEWTQFRLPKASHCYDGAHGWNTEWPRFQDIGEDDFVMNMHGMFWRFPKTFSKANIDGIEPRSTYLKVIGDYCRWGDLLVFGCDDSAKSEFLNKRRAKGKLEPPGQSHSNLWFAQPSILDQLGTPIGRGAVWVDEAVEGSRYSDPFLFSGFDRRGVHVINHGHEPVKFTFRVGLDKPGQQKTIAEISVDAHSSAWHSFEPSDPGTWIRVATDDDCVATVQFHYSNEDKRTTTAESLFDSIATPKSEHVSAGLVRVRGDNLRTLAFAERHFKDGELSEQNFYELDGQMNLQKVDDAKALAWTLEKTAIPENAIQIDAASVLYIDDDGKRWRLPKGDTVFDDQSFFGHERIAREVATERDLLNAHGSFYELPARNAGGFAKIRPICTHNRRIKDYCSYRGLLILSGVDLASSDEDPHVIRSQDGKAALWAGVIDDLWKFGKPIGQGGPWLDSQVVAGEPSDPYLMTGYDKKTLKLSHQSDSPVVITAEVDVTGSGTWAEYKQFKMGAGEVEHQFPAEFAAYWIRFKTSADTKVSATLIYE